MACRITKTTRHNNSLLELTKTNSVHWLVLDKLFVFMGYQRAKSFCYKIPIWVPRIRMLKKEVSWHPNISVFACSFKHAALSLGLVFLSLLFWERTYSYCILGNVKMFIVRRCSPFQSDHFTCICQENWTTLCVSTFFCNTKEVCINFWILGFQNA